MSRLIDADALMAQFDVWDVNDEVWVESIRAEIANAPTIEERKTGKWIDITNIESLEEEYECSVCGYELFYSNPTKFCPNCGARMRGERS